jgi:serine/threonine protein kinase
LRNASAIASAAGARIDGCPGRHQDPGDLVSGSTFTRPARISSQRGALLGRTVARWRVDREPRMMIRRANVITGGSVIGAYHILATIGSGGMGTVYLGEHTLLGRRAAVKLLNPEVSHDRSVVDRFFNEARASAAINHPGIVQIFDFGYAEVGAAYLVMELLEGADLASRIERHGPLPYPTPCA